MNEGHVRPILRNVSGQFISDRVTFTFMNLTLASRNRRFEIDLPELKKNLPKLRLPAEPHGSYQVFIAPARFRSKSQFVRVRPNQTLDLESEFFIRPSEARPRFPSFSTLETKAQWADLRRVWNASDLGAAEYEDLKPVPKGTLLNLHAKMQDQKVAGDRSVFSFVQRIVRVEEERVFFRADPDLLERTREFVKGFRFVPGTLHTNFSEGFNLAASFKTHESVGNLQLTYATNPAGELEVDADLDDHQGIRHAFDVLEHQLTGDKTHPFDIHQVLVRFHRIDPGYYLV